jgi:pilus assembly protein CpaF
MLFSPYASIWNQAAVLSDEYFLMTDVALLEEIFSDQAITDILLDGSNTALIEKNGKLEAINPLFQSENELNQWARNIMNLNNSRLDIAKPIAEVTLDTLVGLLRIHAVLAGECSKRTQVSIRRHTISSLSLESLLSSASLDENQLVILRQIIFQKENFVIIGGTGSGKTTLLKAMLNEVSNERVITIEDAAELSLGGNSVCLTTRANNHEGIGEITLSQLLRESLRMRPDRLVIGEARGEELLLLLQAMNTGHSGSGFSLHANSVQDLLPRMLAILAGIGVAPKLAKILISSSLTWVIEVKRTNSKRSVTSISRLADIHG